MAIREQPSIRRFLQGDLGGLQRLIWQTIDVSYARVYPSRVLAFFKDFHTERSIIERSAIGAVLVTEDDRGLVATGSLVRDEILAVFVHPKSQRRGYGNALTVVLEDEARMSGVAQLALSVSLPSRRFYEGLGYRMVQQCSRDLGVGQCLDFWQARKQLIPL